MICFLLGLLVFVGILIVLGLVGLPLFRITEGYWPDKYEIPICIVVGLVPVIVLPAFLMAMYELGCGIMGLLK